MRYELRVKGVLDSRWSAWFDGLLVTGNDRETIIAGPVTDQAALHGLLAKIRDLGLELLEVRRIDPDRQPGAASSPKIPPAQSTFG